MNTFTVRAQQIGVAGDWHGNTGWAKASLRAFYDAGVTEIFQLGDFGIWGGHDGATFIRKVAKYLKQYGQTLYVTLGNHEDYVRVKNTPLAEDGTQWYQGLEQIKLFPRGFRGVFETLEGHVSFVSLGGANSIDFKGRTEGISWWREESITIGDVYNAVAGGGADIMFCHDAPAGVAMPYDRKGEAAGWDADEIRYSNAGREMLRQAVDGVKPTVLFHGHHHCFQDVDVTFDSNFDGEYKMRSIGLACDQMPQANIIFDVDNHTYQVLTVTA